jgi:PiT family inorganic phosphate transporter
LTILLIALLAATLAFANGANDNFKGVATLHGSGILTFRQALAFTTVATLAGSLVSLMLASQLAKAFSGKGLVPTELVGTTALLLAVGGGAALTILLATRFGLPTSTTHALLGGLIGAAVVARGTELPWTTALQDFAVPLAVSPFLAIALAAALYVPLRAIRRRLGVTHESCLCVGVQRTAATALAANEQGAVMAAAMSPGKIDATIDTISACRGRYEGQVLGIAARPIATGMHLLSGGAVSFSRAVNDTPKIAALLLVVGPELQLPALGLCAVAMAVGGLVASRKVADTMALRLTDMNEGQGLTANLVTAFLVLVASKFGVPVSTTHVSCGSIVGIGAVAKTAKWKTIGEVGLAWLTTLPFAALLSALLFMALR